MPRTLCVSSPPSAAPGLHSDTSYRFTSASSLAGKSLLAVSRSVLSSEISLFLSSKRGGIYCLEDLSFLFLKPVMLRRISGLFPLSHRIFSLLLHSVVDESSSCRSAKMKLLVALRVNDFLTSVNVLEICLHIPIMSQIRRFLCVHVHKQLLPDTAVLSVLPPRDFMKILFTLVAHLQLPKLGVSLYLNSIVICSQSPEREI